MGFSSGGERLPYKQKVTGSNPVTPTRAPLVKWISHLVSTQEFRVRLLEGVPTVAL